MSKHHKNSKVNYRKIWEDVNGKIPKGHHIHHIDGNPYNNELSNLICLSPEEHSEIHKNEFVKWATIGGKLGGDKCRENNLGFFKATEEERKANSLNALSYRQYHLDSERRKQEYADGTRNHWTTYYSAEEIHKKISSGDPGKSNRGKKPWNSGIRMTLKNPELSRQNKSKAALNRSKFKCDCCARLFDAGNLKRHQQAKGKQL